MTGSSRYIIPKHPKSFPAKDKRSGTCGPHSLKSIIEGYYPEMEHPYKHYTASRMSRNTGFMLPTEMLKIFKKFGLSAKRVQCQFSRRTKKIEFLKSAIHQGPIVLLISHTYNSTRHFSFRRLLHMHYIVLWGYDDEKRMFYAYDSNVVRKYHKDPPPIGNISLSYRRMLWYRRLGGYGVYRDFGISVDYGLKS